MNAREETIERALAYSRKAGSLVTEPERRKLADGILDLGLRRSLAVEIGAAVGGVTRLLSYLCRKVVAVDDFCRIHSAGKTVLAELDAVGSSDDVREAFHRNLADELAEGRVELVELNTLQRPWQVLASVRRALGGEKADVVFIDGGHDYETVYSDIGLAKSLARRGGFVVGHDIDLEPVRRAVERHFPTHGHSGDESVRLWWTHLG